MRVAPYLDFVAEVKGVPRAHRRARVQESMERCQVADRRNWLIKNLSKGYRQRVGLAQAIVSDPAVLILDEPTIGLDPQQIAEIRALIKSLAGDHTVILSTHILPGSDWCARAPSQIALDRGRAPSNHRRAVLPDARVKSRSRVAEGIRERTRRIASVCSAVHDELVASRRAFVSSRPGRECGRRSSSSPRAEGGSRECAARNDARRGFMRVCGGRDARAARHVAAARDGVKICRSSENAAHFTSRSRGYHRLDLPARGGYFSIRSSRSHAGSMHRDEPDDGPRVNVTDSVMRPSSRT